MNEGRSGDSAPAPAAITEEQLRKAEAYIEEEEGAANRLSGWAGTIVTAIAVASSLFHLYAAYEIVPTQPLRYTHVAFVMALCFLLFPLARRFRDRIGRDPRLCAVGRRGVHRPRRRPRSARRGPRHHLHRAAARGDAAHHR